MVIEDSLLFGHGAGCSGGVLNLKGFGQAWRACMYISYFCFYLDIICFVVPLFFSCFLLQVSNFLGKELDVNVTC